MAARASVSVNERVRRNRVAFSVGTVGRDMVYALVSTYLVFYLTDVRKLPPDVMLKITNILLAARLFDACNDPIMGAFVNNTRSRFGRFKPWIASGTLLTGVFTMLLFCDLPVAPDRYVTVFAVIFIGWGLAYTANDIAYWSLLPTLSHSQRERDRTGALARIFSSVGVFSVVVLIVPFTGALTRSLGVGGAYTAFAALSVLAMFLSKSITLLFVREDDRSAAARPPASLRSMARAIVKNDQLLVVAVATGLMAVATTTTTSLGIYYFKYIFGDESMYTVFAVVIGVAHIAAMAVYPILRRRAKRETVYLLAVCMLAAGYLLMFFSPANILLLSAAGALCAAGQAMIQLLLLMFLTDTVEYGQWKLGERHESVVFSLQPFLNKFGGAVATWFTGRIVVFAGLQDMPPGTVQGRAAFALKGMMLLVPLGLALVAYIVYRRKYTIDEAFFERMTERAE